MAGDGIGGLKPYAILDRVIGIFQWLNPSGSTMALVSPQPLTEMSTRAVIWVGERCVEMTILPLSCADCLETLGAPSSWNPQSLSRLITGIALQILGNNQLYALFHVFIYFMSLHVSSVTALIIRRSNCINKSSGMISLCKWLLGMPVRREKSSLLTSILSSHLYRLIIPADVLTF